MDHLHVKFHIMGSNGSLDICNELKAEDIPQK
jgi:hypothetical protein